MNWDALKGKWNQFAGQFKSKWGKLTDDDWTFVGGKKDALVGKLQEHYGYQKDQAEKEVDDFIAGLEWSTTIVRTVLTGLPARTLR
jgi:uncharacterized protein YjbJ (UPF0337 family)